MATTSTGLTKSKIVVNAYGTSSDAVNPHFRLMIDGKDVGQASVGSAEPKAYTFDVDVSSAQAHKVQVVYDNDDVNAGSNRDLGIKSIVINGHTLSPTDASYERHDDAGGTMAGQEGLWWNGALSFSTPASL